MPSDANQSLIDQLNAELARLQERNQRRDLVEVRGVNLCSNDYLGLAEDERLLRAVVEAAEKSKQSGATGSRLLSGHAQVWEDLEEEFAEFAGTESALYFGSGYAANLGLLTSLLGKEDLVFSDELNHASLIDGMRLSGAKRVIFPHGDLNALESALRKSGDRKCRKVIVTESVFSMDGDIAAVEAMAVLAERFGAVLLVDEAHATAVHGPQGKGIVASSKAANRVFATIHTCGKALASSGAFVCGPKSLKEFLINRARTFIFTTATPALMAHQVRAALGIAKEMDAERKRLLANASDFAGALQQRGWDISNTKSQIVPAIVGSNADALAAAAHLQHEGFAVRAIRPPTVAEGRARLRFSLTAQITSEQLKRLIDALSSWHVAKHPFAMADHA